MRNTVLKGVHLPEKIEGKDKKERKKKKPGRLGGKKNQFKGSELEEREEGVKSLRLGKERERPGHMSPLTTF
jgi:hypothetical protein